MAVLQNAEARSPEIKAADVAGPAQTTGARPRLALQCAGRRVELWCIQDLMSPAESSSLTWEKARVLPLLVEAPSPRLVIAFGTAATPSSDGRNGSVVVGSSVFMHDPQLPLPDETKRWLHPSLEHLVASTAEPLLADLPATIGSEVTSRMLRPPNGADVSLQLLAGPALVAVGVANVIKTDDYRRADPEALQQFATKVPGGRAGSLETTHGVIRIALDRPFLYISGIANTVGQYDRDVRPNRYAQNTAASHNAAVALAWLLPLVVRQL